MHTCHTCTCANTFACRLVCVRVWACVLASVGVHVCRCQHAHMRIWACMLAGAVVRVESQVWACTRWVGGFHAYEPGPTCLNESTFRQRTRWDIMWPVAKGRWRQHALEGGTAKKDVHSGERMFTVRKDVHGEKGCSW
eukprot:353572-Chlamydomonas_euryale.AAC.12